MKKRILTLPVLILALVLAGCKTKTSDSSSSNNSEIPSESTSTTDPYLAEAEAMLTDLGYNKVNSWPSSVISSFLSDYDVTESVPKLTAKTPLFYDVYSNEENGAVIFEIAILDKTLESLDSAYSVLEGANWVIYEEDENMFDFDSPLQQIILSGEVYEGDDEFPEATYFYIMVADNDGTDPGTGEPEETLVSLGYTKVTSWPTSLISSFLSEYGVSESVPTLSSKTPLFYDEYYGEGEYIFEIAILDDTTASLINIKNVLTAAGWSIYDDAISTDGYISMDSPLEQFYVDAEIYGDEVYPEATYIYICVPDTDGSGGGDVEDVEYESTTGWPVSFVNAYLSSSNLDIVVPNLTVTGEVLYATFIDDFYFNLKLEYISLFIPDANVLDAYEALLTAAGYDVQESTEYEDNYEAYDSSYSLFIDLYYVDDEVTGTFINIVAFGEADGGGEGEVVPPTNPDKNAIFNFVNENQITSGKDTDKTTWTAASSTLVVEKKDSNHKPGNGTFFADPLRLYAGQNITITAGGSNLIEQIKFDINLEKDGGKDSIGQLIAHLGSKATYFTSGSSVTFVFASPVASVSFQISLVDSPQIRLAGMTLYFA